MAKVLSKKLPWGSRDQHDTSQSNSGREESLTTILETQEDRAELTLLLANASDSMRKTITDAFDPKYSEPPNDQDAATTAAGAELADKLDATNLDASTSSNDDGEARRQQEEEKRAKELAAAATLQLKEAALRHFDDWRDSVLLRVGEVVNARPDLTVSGEQQQKGSKKTTDRTASSAEPDSKLDQALPEPSQQDEQVTKALAKAYPPVDTPLAALPDAKKALILHSLLLLLLSLEHYSAHSRVLLLRVTSSLRLSASLLARDEASVAHALLSAAAGEMSADAEAQDQKAKANAKSRKWKVGLAGVAGAALIGITGGLAAPLLAAGIGSVMGGLGLGATAAAGYLGALAGSSVLVGGLFGAYGGRMTGKMMDRYAKEVQDFAFVPVQETHTARSKAKTDTDTEARRLRVAIGVSGWLTDEKEVSEPWHVLAPSIEGFALRWELEALIRLGNSLTTMVKSAAWGVARTEILKRTIFGALAAGLVWPLALMKVSRIIDNPFSVAKARSDKAGEVLADALANRAQGERPVTLVGYSLGARVVSSCLASLADRGAFGVVESAVLLGAPAPSDPAHWRKLRAAVAGRLVNAHSGNDYVLAFLYRAAGAQLGVAGLQPVRGVAGVENVDVSDVVSGHTVYRHLTGVILERIGFEDVSVEDVLREEREMEEEERRDEAERESVGKTSTPGTTATAGGRAAASGEIKDEDVQKMEKEVEEKNKKSMMGWASDKFAQGSGAVGRTWSGVTGSVGGGAKRKQERSGSTPYEGT